MKVKLALGSALVVVLLAGCGAHAGTTRASSVTGCAAFALAAMEHDRPVTRLPRPCRGLGPAELGQAVKIAIGARAARLHNLPRRRRFGRLAPRLGYLTRAEQRATERAATARRIVAALRRRVTDWPGAQARPGPSGLRFPVAWAALIAWLLTEASGALLFAKWLAARRRRRAAAGTAMRAAGTAQGLPPAVIFSHVGLATAGLATWAGYVLTSWAALAWIAFGTLLPVVGLGMSTLVLAIPDPPAPAGTRRPSPSPAGPAPGASVAAAQAVVAAAPAAGEARPAHRPRMPAFLIAAHGALATATMMFALLGTVATGR